MASEESKIIGSDNYIIILTAYENFSGRDPLPACAIFPGLLYGFAEAAEPVRSGTRVNSGNLLNYHRFFRSTNISQGQARGRVANTIALQSAGAGL